jgi:two-component system NtrC family sensor kinase
MSDQVHEVAYHREKQARLVAEEQLERLSKEVYTKNQELANAYESLRKNQITLVQHEKMASVGVLAAGIAHEINNPLGFSLSNLHVLLEYSAELNTLLTNLKGQTDLSSACSTLLNDPQLTFILEDIPALPAESIEGLESVKQIVSDLRGFARSDGGDKTLHNINDSIHSTLNVLRNELKHACEVHTDLTNLPEVPCYIGKLNQVLMNLIINALQAMDEPGGLYITSRAMVDCIEVEIGDDGPGVADDILRDIFSPFFTTKPAGQGTGLGLSICHAIVVDDLGGSLQLLDSGRGQGANFLITLPMNPQQSTDAFLTNNPA